MRCSRLRISIGLRIVGQIFTWMRGWRVRQLAIAPDFDFSEPRFSISAMREYRAKPPKIHGGKRNHVRAMSDRCRWIGILPWDRFPFLAIPILEFNAFRCDDLFRIVEHVKLHCIHAARRAEIQFNPIAGVWRTVACPAVGRIFVIPIIAVIDFGQRGFHRDKRSAQSRVVIAVVVQ